VRINLRAQKYDRRSFAQEEKLEMTETIESFVSYDGLTLFGTYRIPTDNIRAAMLLVHPITAERAFFNDEASLYANHGIATLRFDYRCHGVDGTPMQELSLCGIVNDIDAAFSHLEKLVEDKTPHRYLMGISYSGGLAAYWALHHADRLNRLFLWAPVINYEDDMAHDVGDWVALLQQDGHVKYWGGRSLGRPLMNEMLHINGIQALSSPRVPVLIFHGDRDDNVPLASSQRYCKPNGDCELFVINGGGHMLDALDDDEQTAKNHRTVFEEIIRNIYLDVDGA
jgi:pimeloyl-ACP methyl ester carboxylesterase